MLALILCDALRKRTDTVLEERRAKCGDLAATLTGEDQEPHNNPEFAEIVCGLPDPLDLTCGENAVAGLRRILG